MTGASSKISSRVWAVLILVGLSGQFAWTLENMYFNVYLYNTISTDPGYIAAMVAASAVAATVTTLLMGALSDRAGKRKAFISVGYILWGLSTAAFGFITKESAGKLFPAASVAAAAATLVVVMDCVMTFFGSTANDAAFNAYVTDCVPGDKRGKAESVLAILPSLNKRWGRVSRPSSPSASSSASRTPVSSQRCSSSSRERMSSAPNSP